MMEGRLGLGAWWFNLMLLEKLEERCFLSAHPTGLVPAQVRHAYGFDQVTFRHKRRDVPGDGRGQTVAIVTAYDAPNIQGDLDVFSQTFGLPTTDAYGEPTLTKVVSRSRPRADAGWALEASLDVEWVHAIAPKAHILLVEARSASTADLLSAVDYARSQDGVVAVSMSWGGHETPFDTFRDDYLSTPAGHVGGYGLVGGVTFVSASGDNGQPASWPATSTHVVAVGGTTLTLGRKSRYRGESAWSGSGGRSFAVPGDVRARRRVRRGPCERVLGVRQHDRGRLADRWRDERGVSAVGGVDRHRERGARTGGAGVARRAGRDAERDPHDAGAEF
jgi:subtilase family serine protease